MKQTSTKTRKRQNHRNQHNAAAGARHQTAERIQELNEHQTRLADMTMRAGSKAQEEAMRGWTNLLGQAASPADWQKGVARFTQFAANFMPQAQQRMAEMMELVHDNGRAGAQLVRKAIDAAQTPSFAGSQAKWIDFWAASMKAFECSTQSVTKISTRAIDDWIEFLKRTTQMDGAAA